jgi:signal transduction histidine kinase
MAHVDTDRHRVAAHLHRQAVSLYTSMATLTCALDRTDAADSPTAVTMAAEQLRRDLERRADGLQRIAVAVKPLSATEREGRGLDAPIRAYVENLYDGGPRPELEVSIDEDLVLDWTTEAILVRIVQEAAGNVRRHSHAQGVKVRIGVTDDTLRLEIEDDGVGSAAIHEGRGIAAMRSMARFLDGTLTVTSVEGAGTLVSAAIELDALPEPPRPTLRLVAD